MNNYETVFILTPVLSDEQAKEAVKKIEGEIKTLKGKVRHSESWGLRKLAYPINGHRKGSYWLIYFSMDGPNLVAFERQCELNENVLRRLILKIDPRLAEPLVQHAQAGNSSTKPAPTTAVK